MIAGEPGKSELLRYLDLPEERSQAHAPQRQNPGDRRREADPRTGGWRPERPRTKTVAELAPPEDVRLAMERSCPRRSAKSKKQPRKNGSPDSPQSSRICKSGCPATCAPSLPGRRTWISPRTLARPLWRQPARGPGPGGGQYRLLDLSRTQVTDSGLETLRTMPNLRRLQIQETNTGDKGIMAIETLGQTGSFEPVRDPCHRSGPLRLCFLEKSA